jgi:hypothetical protein
MMTEPERRRDPLEVLLSVADDLPSRHGDPPSRDLLTRLLALEVENLHVDHSERSTITATVRQMIEKAAEQS